MATALAGSLVARLVLLALRHPQRFRGVGRFGWQASVYRHVHRFASAGVTLIARRALSPADLGGRVGCNNLAQRYRNVLTTHAMAVARSCSEAVGSGLWDRLPAASKATIVERVRRDGEQALAVALTDFDDEASQEANVQSLVTAALSRNGHALLEQLLASSGADELRFIELCGAIAGIYAGVIEVIIWGIYPSAGMPVLVAAAVGSGVSWLALRMLVRPHHSTKYFWAVTYQGLLPKRRRELAAGLAAAVAHEAATDRHLIGMLTDGRGGQDLAHALLNAIDPQASHGDGALDRVREALVEQMVGLAPQFTVDLEAYREFEEEIAALVLRRLLTADSREMEPLLANVLAPDTAILITLGAGFGILVGLLQAVLL